MKYIVKTEEELNLIHNIIVYYHNKLHSFNLKERQKQFPGHGISYQGLLIHEKQVRDLKEFLDEIHS